jgi:hypothetical protein
MRQHGNTKCEPKSCFHNESCVDRSYTKFHPNVRLHYLRTVSFTSACPQNSAFCPPPLTHTHFSLYNSTVIQRTQILPALSSGHPVSFTSTLPVSDGRAGRAWETLSRVTRFRNELSLFARFSLSSTQSKESKCHTAVVELETTRVCVARHLHVLPPP